VQGRKVLQNFELMQNYPNPFNPRTTIEFYLPIQTQVELNIYNSLGQKVAELINSSLPAGNHSAIWFASDEPSGIYFYELSTANQKKIKQIMMLIK
jgi:hypothetical protein